MIKPPHRNRPQAAAEAQAIEREARSSLLAAPFGAGSVADLALPDEFVGRVAARALIARFNQRFRIVVGQAPARPAQAPPPDAGGRSPLVRTVEGVACRGSRWAGAPVEVTAVLRGFRMPGPGEPDDWPCEPPGPDAPYELRRAATLVSRGLARDGLAATALEAALALRPLYARADRDALEGLLRRAGLPTDLLGMLVLQDVDGFARGACLDWLLARIQEGAPSAAVRTRLRQAGLDFRPSLPGFRATDDAGGGPPLLARLQLTRADHWFGEGDGGALDIARQVAAALPGVPIVLSAHADHAPIAARHAAEWAQAARRTAPITVITEHVTVSQWAQDNARAGTIERNGAPVPAAVLPRYASRSDELSGFVPGDSALAGSLPLAGIEIARSPLLFQGGNTLLVHDRAAGRRVLLVGEAEIYRNVGLGLTREQALAALTAEFGADTAVVLPAASYHIDYEVLPCVNAATGAVTALVNDSEAAERAIVEAGIAALGRAGRLPEAVAVRAEAALRHGAPAADSLSEVWHELTKDFVQASGFALTTASTLTAGTPGESFVGNFLVFLDALDTLSARAGLATGSGAVSSVMAARLRPEGDRTKIRTMLSDLGWRIAPVPGYASGDRSVCPLNGVWAGPALLLPAARGALGTLDIAAANNIRELIGQYPLVPIGAAESMRRNGAIRCALALFA